MDCIFCKMIKNEIEVEKVYEDKNMIIIRDIEPKAKHHFLLIPKRHFAHLEDAGLRDQIMLGNALKKLPKLQDLLHLKNGYRLVVNQGKNAGQSVQHFHIHLLSGQKMDWNPA